MSEREIFLEAVELPTPEARAEYLESACGPDAALRRAVEELLRQHFSADGPLSGTGWDAEPQEVAPVHGPPFDDAPTETIGRYKLLEKLGEGGFGEVWMAEQREPVKRRVALKIIKLGMDSRQVVARFEAERQALAMMDHANIAKIIDADVTDTGRPYFVMELVRGIKITDYCDQNQLTTGDRLELFVKVCRAIQHAHQKGIIHRDIKPSNILVTLHDGVPVPKVIDFGIAKATQQELTDKTVFTQFQQFVGTPAYISPEQAEMSGLDIDTRADIYSLGVLLYELMVGQTPFDPKEMIKGGLDALRRIIREREPLPPSTKVNTLSGSARTTAGKRRQTDPVRLVHQLQGDLDWIVMKCLEKDRTRRYDTANGLAMDIQRHLNNEPIVARPPSMSYRMGKLFRRNKLAFMAGIFVSLALLSGTAGVMFVQHRANQDYRHRLYISEVNRAGLAWQGGQTVQLRDLLERCPADRRHWEWNFLHQQLNRWERKVLVASTNLGEIVLNKDASLMALVNRGVIQVRSVSSGQWLRDIPATIRTGSNLALTPTGEVLAVAESGGISVWNVRTGERLAGINDGTALHLAWSHDGQRLAFAGKESLVHIWSLPLGREEKPIQVPAEVLSLAFAPDDRVLAVGTTQSGIELLDAARGAASRRLQARGTKFWRLQFSPDSRNLAVANQTLGGFGRDDRVWNLDGEGGSLDLSTGPEAERFSFSADSRRLVVGDTSGMIQIWDLAQHAELERFPAGRTSGSAVHWLGDDRILGIDPEGVCVWHAARGGVTSLAGYPFSLRTAAFSPDSRWLVGGGLSQKVFVWDTRGGQLAGIYPEHAGETVAVAFGRNGLVASADETQSVRLWNPTSLETHWKTALAAPDAWWLAFSPDDRLLYVLSRSKTLSVLDTASGKLVKSVSGLGEVLDGIAVSPDGKLIAVCRKLAVSIRRAEDLEEVWNAPSKPNRCAAFSPDGKWLAVGEMDGTVSLWETAAGGRVRRSLHGHVGSVSGVGFHPDGSRLVSCGLDGRVKVWDWRAAVELMTLRTPGGGQLWHTGFSPDGKMIFAAGGDGIVTLWRTE